MPLQKIVQVGAFGERPFTPYLKVKLHKSLSENYPACTRQWAKAALSIRSATPGDKGALAPCCRIFRQALSPLLSQFNDRGFMDFAKALVKDALDGMVIQWFMENAPPDLVKNTYPVGWFLA